MSSHLFSPLLTSSRLISALVSSSHLISAPLCALSNHLSPSPAQNPLRFPHSTTLYYKTRAKYFPVQLCTTKLAQTLPSTTLYYKAGTKYFPVLLCTTKLAQSTSQYYFVRQSLHKVFLCTTRLAQNTLHTASFYTEKLLHREAFTHSKLLRRLLACRFWTGAFTNRCLPHCFLQCFLKASVTTYQKQEVLAEKCPPPR